MGGYSAKVELFVEIGSQRYGVNNVGPEAFYVDDKSTVNLIPGCTGVLVVSVDSKQQRTRCEFPDGFKAGRVRYLRLK